MRFLGLLFFTASKASIGFDEDDTANTSVWKPTTPKIRLEIRIECQKGVFSLLNNTFLYVGRELREAVSLFCWFCKIFLRLICNQNCRIFCKKPYYRPYLVYCGILLGTGINDRVRGFLSQ